jgi:hypothetical protein
VPNFYGPPAPATLLSIAGGAAVGLPGDFLFLDESGDLGSAAGSTEIFAIGILHLRSRDALKRAIKRARKKSLGRNAHLNELKWSQSSEAVRSAVIAQVVREASQIAGISACVIEKSWINDRLARRREEVRYNYAVRLALEKGLLFDEAAKGRRIHLMIDARNRRATETLTEYVRLLIANDELSCDMAVAANDSMKSPQLQAADFAVGAIYAAYAHNDWRYLNVLRRAGIRVELRSLKKKRQLPEAS